MPRGLPRAVKEHLTKARDSATLAVEVYNKPGTRFRSGAYIVLMCIAWTSLLHAVFLRKGQKPYYRDPKRPRRYLKVDGDYNTWELAECIRRYFPDDHAPEVANLRFFVSLRNKIEHRSMPALDPFIFGECQALLLNFEDTLFQEFGAKQAINESLALALQFSHLRDERQAQAIASLHKPLLKDIRDYIETFRSSLSVELLHDLRYSYKVFLVPKLANHLGQADVAVEFVKYDPDSPEDMDQYARLVSMIRPQAIQVANQGTLRPIDICRAVEPVVRQVCGPHKRFVPSTHHVSAWRFYAVRPGRGEGDPTATRAEYCQYDEAHGDYVYTTAWRDFLIHEMRKPGKYEEVMAGRAR